MKSFLNICFYTVMAIILSACSACSGKKGGGAPPVGNVGNSVKEIEVVRLGDIYTNQGNLPIPFRVEGSLADQAVGEIFSDSECTVKIDDILDFETPYDLNSIALNSEMDVYLKVMVDNVEKVACELVATVNHSDVPPSAPEVSSTAFDVISNQFPSTINLPNNGGPLSINTNGIVFPPGLIKKLLIVSPGGDVIAEILEEDLGSIVDIDLDLTSLGEDVPLGVSLAYEDIYGNQSTPTVDPAITVVRTSAPVVEIDTSPALADNLTNGFVGENHSIPVTSNRSVDYSILVDGVEVDIGNGTSFNANVVIPGEDGSSITYEIVTVDEFGNENNVTVGPLFQVPFSVTKDILPAIQSLIDTRFTDFTPAQIDLLTNRQANYAVRVGGTANGVTGTSAAGEISFNHAFGGLVATPDVVDVVVTDSYENERVIAIGTFNPPLFEVSANYNLAFTNGLATEFDGPSQVIELTTNRPATFVASVGGVEIATGSSSANAISVPVEITGVNGESTTVVTTVTDSYGNEVEIVTGPMTWTEFSASENYNAAILDGIANGFDDENQTIDLTVTRPATFVASVGGVEIATGSSVDGDISFPVVLSGVHGETTTVEIVVTDSTYGNVVTVETPAFEMNQFEADFDTATLAAMAAGYTELNPVAVIEANRDYTFTATGPLQTGSESGNQASTITLEVPGIFDDREAITVTLEDRFGNEISLSNDIWMRDLSLTMDPSFDLINNTKTMNNVAVIEFSNISPLRKVELVENPGGQLINEFLIGDTVGANSISVNIAEGVNDTSLVFFDAFGNTQSFALYINRVLVDNVVGVNNSACSILSDGSIYCWGANDSGQLGVGDENNKPSPTKTSSPELFKLLRKANNHTCAISLSDDLYCWGANIVGQLGVGDEIKRSSPELVLGGIKFKSVELGLSVTCAISLSDDLYCWGSNSVGRLGVGEANESLIENSPRMVDGSIKYKKLVMGTNHTCAISLSDDLYCWGSNALGQLGVGINTEEYSPTLVSSTVKFKEVSLANHTCAISLSDDLYCWGYNNKGQLGVGDEIDKALPTLVLGGLSFKEIVAVATHTCAISLSDDLYCWGDNAQGQLGVGDEINRSSPTPVSGGVKFSQVISSSINTCGISLADDLYCWGNNLGFGTVGNNFESGIFNTPQSVANSTAKMSKFGATSWSIDNDGLLYSWGRDTSGHLGLPGTTEIYTPTQIQFDLSN